MKSRSALAALALGLAALAAQAQPDALRGEVLETLDVPGYTYLRLKTDAGEIWAAVPTAPVKKGARVSLVNPAVMKNFESKTLRKTFDRIVFAQLAEPPALKGAPQAAAPDTTVAAVAAAAAAPAPKVARANDPGARTIAEVFAGKAALKDKAVVVRGQVVKVNLGIMGKNWVHLRDGSGSASGGTNDLLVTTQDSAAVGDIVTAKGLLRSDVTVGAGHSYAVLIEDAALRR